MGHMACTEPQCLYKGALYFTFIQVQERKERRMKRNRMRGREQGKDKYVQTFWMICTMYFI
jgi:hypothetical protein